MTMTTPTMKTTMSPLPTEPATLYIPKEAEAPDRADASHPSRDATSDGGDDARRTQACL
jgi:septal ring-binding cell division protein DamX